MARIAARAEWRVSCAFGTGKHGKSCGLKSDAEVSVQEQQGWVRLETGEGEIERCAEKSPRNAQKAIPHASQESWAHHGPLYPSPGRPEAQYPLNSRVRSETRLWKSVLPRTFFLTLSQVGLINAGVRSEQAVSTDTDLDCVICYFMNM